MSRESQGYRTAWRIAERLDTCYHCPKHGLRQEEGQIVLYCTLCGERVAFNGTCRERYA